MPIARFPYFHDLPTVSLTFSAHGSARAIIRRLLVDSGFTGRSSLIASHADCGKFGHLVASAGDVYGAIQGIHQRVWISCEIPELLFEASMITIAADLAAFSLPEGIDGLAGLSFLNQFRRWGAEQNQAGAWEFVLET